MMKVERIERELRQLRKEREEVKETWIKATDVMKFTGWDRERMRRARINGQVKQKKEDNKIWYLFESIPQQFIKKTEQA